MPDTFDLKGLSSAYRRLVLCFGLQLFWALNQMTVQPIADRIGAGVPASLLLLAGTLAIVAAMAYYGYRTAAALGSEVPWLWGGAMLIPLVSIVVLLALSLQATRTCKAQGIPVGFFGPKIAIPS